jgi:hypothetical protein
MRNHSRTRAKAFVCCVVGSLVIAVAGGCSVDASEAEEPAADQVEVLDLKVGIDQSAVLDLDRAGASLGDLYVYSGSAVQDGRTVGRGGGSCRVIHLEGDTATRQCVLTLELEDGSLTMQSLYVSGTGPLDMAITGGTGAYSNARGTVRFWDIATPNERARAEIVR